MGRYVSLLRSLRTLSFTVGHEFNVVIVSFNSKDTPALAAAKTLPATRVGEDIERGGALAVKRAQPFKGLSHLLQGDDRADLLDDIELLLDALDGAGFGHQCVLRDRDGLLVGTTRLPNAYRCIFNA